jgi:hypothetical protein
LKSQYVISSSHGGRRPAPWAFTEHGVVMAAQTYLETGEATGFLETLRTLSGE